MVFDEEGSCLQPTHSKKFGRKYRYYVSASIIKEAKAAKNGLRIPAPDLERLVLRALTAKLKDKVWIEKTFKFNDPASLALTIEKFGLLANEIERLATNNTGILPKIVARIVASKTLVTIELNVVDLKHVLCLSSAEPANERTELRIESHLLRCGKQMKLVLGAETSQQTNSDPRLIAELVQARQWFESLVSGKAGSLAQIAQTAGFNQSHVSRRITLAFLAPNLVEMILSGTQPLSLTPERLKKACPLPASWVEQRALLLS